MDSPKNKFLDAVGAQDIVVSHCIIHQENLCTITLAFAEGMKIFAQCANVVRARGMNHRQLKAFLEYLHCDYPDVEYFSAIRWLSGVATLKRFLESATVEAVNGE